MQYTFVRRNRRALAVIGLGAAAFTSVSLLMPAPARWMFLGAWPTAIAAMVTHVVVVASGAARLTMADQGEQWTREELKEARKRGWKVVHRVLFRAYGDIDTVAVGPPGIVVIETKWSSEDWGSAKQAPWVAKAAAQAADNASVVERQMRQAVGPAPIWPVVVLWPSDGAFGVREINGVTVLPGLQLREWIRMLPDRAVDDEFVRAAWTFLDQHLAKRDAYDLETSEPMPRSPMEYLGDVLQYAVGGLAATFAVALLLEHVRWPVTVVPALCSAAFAGWTMRFAALRRVAVAATLTIAGVLAALLAIQAVDVIV